MKVVLKFICAYQLIFVHCGHIRKRAARKAAQRYIFFRTYASIIAIILQIMPFLLSSVCKMTDFVHPMSVDEVVRIR